MRISYVERPPLDSAALNEFFSRTNPEHRPCDFSEVLRRCLTYICAYAGTQMIGFVKVATDGGDHAFLLDPTVDPRYRRQGIGTELVKRATESSRAAGCEWLHVDHEPALEEFYSRAGFRPTKAGLIRLT